MRPLLALTLATMLCGCAQTPSGLAPVATHGAPAAAFLGGPLLTLQAESLALARQRVQQGDAALQAPMAALKRRADQALLAAPRSVTHKTTVPPSGSKNDYMSRGPYWWPNPATPDGLPYLQRDGQRNPEVAGQAFDGGRLQAMLADVRDLALAFHFTAEARYAQKAAVVIRTWFLNPATRMNPNLRYAQGIPGIVDGRGIGIIDTRDLWLVIDAVALIAPQATVSSTAAEGAWTRADRQALRQWFANYAQWLVSSPQGRDEAAELNNHGLFYDVQLVAYWLFVGETEKARRLVFDAQTRRIAAQIDAQGRMPLELARTRPFHYQAFTLEAATRLARYGQVLEAVAHRVSTVAASDPRCKGLAPLWGCPLDLWRAVVDGRSLRAALDYLAQAVVSPNLWPHATVLEPAPPLSRSLPALLTAQGAYPPPGFAPALSVLKEVAPDHVGWLMWPVP